MKKIKGIIAIIIFALIASFAVMPALAEQSDPIVLFSGARTTGPGDPQTPPDDYVYYTVQVNIVGSPTAVTVRLEGNVSGDTYTVMGTKIFSADELAAGQAIFTAINQPCSRIRGYVVTLTGGTNAQVAMITKGAK